MFDPLHPTPPGWPPQVRAPGLPGWEDSARKWLLDQVPGEWRAIDLYQQQPLLLARDARYHTQGAIQGLRESYRNARVEVANVREPMQRREDGGHQDRDAIPDIPLPALDDYLHMHALEGARLVALNRQITLVEDALRGVRWVPRKESFG